LKNKFAKRKQEDKKEKNLQKKKNVVEEKWRNKHVQIFPRRQKKGGVN
jgi:hypothetical protein